MLDSDYKPIIEAYLSNSLPVDSFITDFMHQWKADRDEAWGHPFKDEQPSEVRFHEMMNRLFTSCDCYNEHPEAPHEINEQTLRTEVALFYNIIWEQAKSQNWQAGLGYADVNRLIG